MGRTLSATGGVYRTAAAPSNHARRLAAEVARKNNVERRAARRVIDGPDSPVVRGDDGVREVQAEAGPLGAAGERVIDPMEALENALELVRGDAAALVADGEVHLFIVVSAAYDDVAALRRILDRVAEQIVDHLTQPRLVAGDDRETFL